MTSAALKYQVEFGDFQTPDFLAKAVCERLVKMGISPDLIIEPTCGVGAFVLATAETFKANKILGFDINPDYLEVLHKKSLLNETTLIHTEVADFFKLAWQTTIDSNQGDLLVLGNFPWVTNSTQGNNKGFNLPKKANFKNHQGLEALTGKANFDISEWMLLETIKWFEKRDGTIAMLVKTSVARKIINYAQQNTTNLSACCLIKIDSKQAFNVSVDAGLLVLQFKAHQPTQQDYCIYDDLNDFVGKTIGTRLGLTISNLANFEKYNYLVGKSPQKWRSGIKHDASAIMELTYDDKQLINGHGELVNIEADYLYPLLKGSDIGSNKDWRHKYVLVTQRYVGEVTQTIATTAPKTWQYLERYATTLNARASSIYLNNPMFSIFGIGEYAFKPYKIAICGLYKHLKFRLVQPLTNKPVMFDDTVYYLSFDTEREAQQVLNGLQTPAAQALLNSLIFWDEKRPIKASLLNLLDWTELLDIAAPKQQLNLNLSA